MKPRILLVEDEALVAMMMEDVLADMGWTVAGSFGDVRGALSWLEAEAVDAAVLDINLGDEMVFPVAEALKSSGTPFTFLTGYTSPRRVEEFDAPMLTKPVDLAALERVLQSLRKSAIAAGE